MAQSDISRTDCPRTWHGAPGLTLASPAVLGLAHRPFSNSHFLLEAQLFGGPGAELSVEGTFPEYSISDIVLCSQIPPPRRQTPPPGSRSRQR